MQALAAGRHAPGSLLIKQRVGFSKMIARRLDPKAQLVVKRQGMVGAVGDDQDRPVQVQVQCGKDRQAGGARQSQTGERFPIGLELFQQLLIGRKRAYRIEKSFHI